MIALRLICASGDLERAHAIARLLGAEGFPVEIAYRRLAADADDPNTPICGIVLWSHLSIDSWPVLQMAEPLHAARALVQVALEPVVVPHHLQATPGPIDFSRWSERDRGSTLWDTLRGRIDRVEDGDDPSAAHVGAVASVAAASLAILALAVSNRVIEGPAGDAIAADDHMLSVASAPTMPTEAAGGPVRSESELIDETIRVRMVRVPATLRMGPAPAISELAAPASLPTMHIVRPSFLRRVLNAAESLPLIGDSDRPAA